MVITSLSVNDEVDVSRLRALLVDPAHARKGVSHGMTTLRGDAAYRFTHMRKWLDVAIAAHA